MVDNTTPDPRMRDTIRGIILEWREKANEANLLQNDNVDYKLNIDVRNFYNRCAEYGEQLLASVAPTLTSAAVEVLGQLFVHGPTWDGNVVSKGGRDELVYVGYVVCSDGYQWLTDTGVKVALAYDLTAWSRESPLANAWRAKQGHR